MLNENGKIIGDFTIAKVSDTRFMMWGSIGAQKYHMRWFQKHLPASGGVNPTDGSLASTGSVSVHRFGMNLVGISIVGPNARKVLQKLTDEDVSGDAFRFMDFRNMDVNCAPCMVNRISYAGDLGYEIWMAPAYQRRVYEGIKDAGEEFAICDFGMRALLSMRLEKNFPTWGFELRPIYGPFEGGMERFVKMSKNDFIGRDAAARENEGGGKLRRVSFAIDPPQGGGDLSADVMHDEPIWAKTGGTDYGTIPIPHDTGPKRFTSDGTALSPPGMASMVDGDWRVVGWVTSGGYAHYVGKSVAQGYIPAELAENDMDEMFQIEILGVRCPARICPEPLFDPSGERMRL